MANGLIYQKLCNIPICKSWRKRQRMFLRTVDEYRPILNQNCQEKNALIPQFFMGWPRHTRGVPKIMSLTFVLLNPFPHDRILDQIKLKAFVNDKLNVKKMTISVFDRAENIVGKGEIACTSNCLFPTMFSKCFFSRPVKWCHCVRMGKICVVWSFYFSLSFKILATCTYEPFQVVNPI